MVQRIDGDKGIRRITILATLMIICVVFACLCAWKLSDHVIVRQNENIGNELTVSNPLDGYMMIKQPFMAKHEHLNSLGIKISQAFPEAGNAGVFLTLYDEEYNEITKASTLVSMMPENEYYYFLLNVDLKIGEIYTYVLEYAGTENTIPEFVAYTVDNEYGDENGYYLYDGDTVGALALATDYQYVTILGGTVSFLLGVIVVFGGLVFFLVLRKFIKKEWLNKKVYPLSWLVYHETAMLYALCGFIGLVYLSLIWNHNIWTDEAFTVDLLRNCKTVSEVWEFTAGDVHPPLYYMILLPFSNLFGIRLWMLKFLSIIPMVLTLLLGPTYIKKRFGNKVAWLYVVILTALPITMEYAVQVRMYSWAMWFLTLCALMAFHAYETGKIKYYVIVALSGTACAYTHYFTFISAIWVYGFFFLAVVFTKEKRKDLLKWLGMAAGSVILFLPWLPSMIRQVTGVSGSYWISEITKKVLREYLDWFFETDLPYAPVMIQTVCLIAFVLFVAAIIQNRKAGDEEKIQKRRELIAVLLDPMVLIGTVFMGVLLSELIRPIFIIRYAIPCMGLLALFLAYTLSKLDKKLYALVIAFWVTMGIVEYTDTHYTEYDSTLAPEMIAFFDEHLGENDYVMYNYKMFDFIYMYYFDAEDMVYVEDFDWNSDFDDVWFLCTTFQPEIPGEIMQSHGLTRTFVGNYSIEHNQFALYQIRKN